jgi:hypothetical protein
VLFRSHYGFDAFYCQPGIDGAHEKGGVEGEVGWFRRNHLTPMPEVDHPGRTQRQDPRLGSRRQHPPHHRPRQHDRRRTTTPNSTLAPLPVRRFDPGLILHPRVDRSALITVRMVKYSVPAHLIGRRVRVSLRASCVVVSTAAPWSPPPRLGTHRAPSGRPGPLPRGPAHQARRVPGSTALAQARAAGTFTPAHEAFWAAARKVNGDADGTRELIDVLLLHRSMNQPTS